MARKLLDLSIDIDEDRLNHAIEVLNENNLSIEHAVKLFFYSVSNNNRSLPWFPATCVPVSESPETRR